MRLDCIHSPHMQVQCSEVPLASDLPLAKLSPVIQRGQGARCFLAQSCQAEYTAGEGTRPRVPIG